VAAWTVVFGANKADYQDSNGHWHYVVELASIAATAVITDQRVRQPIATDLVNYLAARNGDYENLRARATTKDDVDLGNLPNAKSDDPASDSSEVLATTKALQTLRTTVDNALRGMVSHFAMAAPPAGWLRANGAAVSRTAYADLFSRIGTTHGAGDGSTTFSLPDLRGEFIRGWDNGRGVDVGRGLGSLQGSQNLEHDHDAETKPAGKHDHEISVPRDLGKQADGDNDAFLGDEVQEGIAVIKTNMAPDHVHVVTVESSGGTESRPRNIALLACIKY
jgi:microcystin-dependent protein